LKIGIDFDNTIVSYDGVFHKYALKKGLIDAAVPVRKNAVRDSIRRTSGNDAWTGLQAFVYSEGMPEARVAGGFEGFLDWAGKHAVPLYVISHKTALAAIGPGIDLRAPARKWLESQAFLSSAALGAGVEERVFFEETRKEKLARIRQCGLTHFIDDLPEVFAEAGFPENVTKILYSPGGVSTDSGVRSFGSWAEIRQYFESAAC